MAVLGRRHQQDGDVEGGDGAAAASAAATAAAAAAAARGTANGGATAATGAVFWDSAGGVGGGDSDDDLERALLSGLDAQAWATTATAQNCNVGGGGGGGAQPLTPRSAVAGRSPRSPGGRSPYGRSPATPAGAYLDAWRASALTLSAARRQQQQGNNAAPSAPPSLNMPLLPPAASLAAGPWYRRDAAALGGMLLSSWFNVLLVCVPLGVAAWGLRWGPIAVFALNFFALVPLALLLGDVTEDLALRFGDVVGGLLNATFGNVVEVILAIAALMKGLYTVVATSLLGSILSNLLLVLGCCFLFGGL